MKILDGFIVRKVGDDNVVVPIGERSKEFHGMVKLNETATFMWNFFSESEHSKDECVSALMSEYDVEKDVAEADVQSFMDSLLKAGLAK